MSSFRTFLPWLILPLIAGLMFLVLGLVGFLVTGASSAVPRALVSDTNPADTSLGLADTIHALARDTSDMLRLDASGRVLARARLSEAPTALVLMAPAARAVAAATGTRRLWSLDAATLGDPRSVVIGHEPDLLSPAPDGNVIAVGAIGQGVVSLHDPATLAELARIEGLEGVHDLRFSPDGARLYASTLDGARLLTLDGRTLAVIDEIALDAPGIDHMSRTPNGRIGLAVAPGSPVVRRIDLSRMPRPAAAITLPEPPARAYLSEAGDRAWMGGTANATLYRLDLASGAVRPFALPGMMRTRTEEPFSPHALIATDGGLVRMDGNGVTLAIADTAEPVVAMLPIEGVAATVLLDGAGRLLRVDALNALQPVALEQSPPLFAITGVNDLAFCHGG